MSDLTPYSQELEFDKSVSQEEQDAILESINEMVVKTKLSTQRTPQILKATKKGFIFPLLINLLAILAVAASFVLADLFFQQRQESMVEETQIYLSAEGKLLEKLKEESQEQLAAKDEEIGQIQEELANLRQRSSDLESKMEDTIRAKEISLREEMEAALEAERKILAAAGSSEAEIQARLREMENELRAKNNETLAAFRRESEIALEAQRKDLEATISKNQNLLQEANEEKRRLEEENRRKQAELESQFEQEKAALEAKNQEARDRLESLSQDQEQKRLIQDQVDGVYQAIISRMNQQQYPQALAELQGLRTLLTSDTLRSFPEFVQSQEVDLFLLETLENDMRTRLRASEVDASGGASLAAAEALAQQGMDSLEGGNAEAAEKLFKDALEELPLLAASVQSLEDIVLDRRTQAVNAALTEGETQLRRRQWPEAAIRFRSAASRAGEASPELIFKSLEGLVSAYTSQITEEINTRDSQLENQEEEILALKSQLSERTDAQNSLLDNQEENLLELQDQLSRREEELSELEIQLSQKKEELSELGAQLSERIDTQDSLSGNQDDNLSKLRSQLSQKVEEVSELQSQLFQKNAAIEERDGAIKELEETLIERQKAHAAALALKDQEFFVTNLGTVSRIEGSRITIQTPVDWNFKKGTPVSIHRQIRSQEPVLLANGEITSVSIEAEVKPNLSSFNVEQDDQVIIVGD